MSKVTFVTVIEAWVDVAQHICATEGWGPPADNGDAVRLLGGHRVLTTELAISIREAVGFRNVACRYRLHGCDLAPSLASRIVATWRFQRVWAWRLACAGQGGWQLSPFERGGWRERR